MTTKELSWPEWSAQTGPKNTQRVRETDAICTDSNKPTSNKQLIVSLYADMTLNKMTNLESFFVCLLFQEPLDTSGLYLNVAGQKKGER